MAIGYGGERAIYQLVEAFGEQCRDWTLLWRAVLGLAGMLERCVVIGYWTVFPIDVSDLRGSVFLAAVKALSSVT